MSFNPYSNRILFIDDVAEIHQDFRKILEYPAPELAEMKEALFGISQDSREKFPVYEMDSAYQGEEGFQLVKKSIEDKKPYFMAFIDIRMPPGWDGVETIEKIWSIDPDIQTVICTAFSDYAWQDMVKKLGFSDRLLILKKPFDVIEVRQLTTALSQKWALVQQNRSQLNTLQNMVDERTAVIRATLEAAKDGILVLNQDETILDYNSNFVLIWSHLGVDVEKFLSTATTRNLIRFICNNICDSKILEPAIENLFLRFDLEPLDDVHLELRLKNGNYVELFSRSLLVKEQIMGRVFSFRDVTERIHYEEQLAFQATHDLLTHLPNRMLLIDRLEQAIFQARREKHQLAVIFLDLDRFKNVNDSLGHNFGDELLKTVAENLSMSKRETDTLCRIGGDEFILIVPKIIENRYPLPLIKKIHECIKQPLLINDRKITITASIGVSIFPQDGQTADALLKNADAAMYRAKSRGKNTIQFYEPDMNTQIQQRLELEQNLYYAYKLGELLVYYQPIVNTKTGLIAGTEALLRWKHPTFGLIEPGKFIPIAEETGLIIPIGEWILKVACEQNLAWQKMGLPIIPMSINLSGVQLKSAENLLQIENLLDQIAYDGKLLQLELTENVLMQSSSQIQKILYRLSKKGVQFAIDDFGTGYSNLSYFMSFPIAKLKIDKSFVDMISENTGKEKIIQALIKMAHSINIKVTAEGIETKEQLEFLRDNECDEIQGFYFGKPMEAQDYTRVLELEFSKMS